MRGNDSNHGWNSEGWLYNYYIYLERCSCLHMDMIKIVLLLIWPRTLASDKNKLFLGFLWCYSNSIYIWLLSPPSGHCQATVVSLYPPVYTGLYTGSASTWWIDIRQWTQNGNCEGNEHCWILLQWGTLHDKAVIFILV